MIHVLAFLGGLSIAAVAYLVRRFYWTVADALGKGVLVVVWVVGVVTLVASVSGYDPQGETVTIMYFLAYAVLLCAAALMTLSFLVAGLQSFRLTPGFWQLVRSAIPEVLGFGWFALAIGQAAQPPEDAASLARSLALAGWVLGVLICPWVIRSRRPATEHETYPRG